MRGHVHEQFLWRVTDRGHFQPLWYGKKWRCRHSLPPPTTFDCRSIADRSVVFNGSPKARKSQLYVGVYTYGRSKNHRRPAPVASAPDSLVAREPAAGAYQGWSLTPSHQPGACLLLPLEQTRSA